jgi:hypothetical protein
MEGVVLDTLKEDWIESSAIKIGWILVVSLQSQVSPSLGLITLINLFLYVIILDQSYII